MREVFGIVLAEVLDVDQEDPLERVSEGVKSFEELLKVLHKLSLGVFNDLPVDARIEERLTFFRRQERRGLSRCLLKDPPR